MMTLSDSFRITMTLAWLVFSAVGLVQAASDGKVTGVENMDHKYTNKLINESSPYLLQHAHNPVDWYPWSKEAFEIAKSQDKPIFLSIGYSSCHWCHVMERESFSNEELAKVLNENFVSIKVDREQRPDVDNVYMNAVQMMTGSGGWPLSVFLTPQGRPFYGGTYFPAEDAYGRPGFKKMLLAISEAWKNRRTELLESAGKISEALKDLGKQPGKKILSPDTLQEAQSYLKRIFDSTYGGFGSAPKFPQPSNLSMLLSYWYRTADEESLEMVEATLDAMAKGGIYDHIGGGFHRYSTDERWLVPHFEKMLYDQALLSKSYIQAYQVTGKETYARVAKEIFDYVLRDMTDAKGGFYSAEDADSEGGEGRFYVWEPQEIKDVLGKDEAEVFNEYYGVTGRGNFEAGKSILNISKSPHDLAKQFKRDRKAIENILMKGRSKLLKHRAKRPRPYRDDKVIVAWNGLMISSLAYGGAALGEARYIDAAQNCAEFVLGTLQRDGRLMRYYRNGETVGLGFLDDYAFMIMGLLDLYEATFDVRWLIESKKLAEQMIELFGDEKGGGFYLVGNDAERLIVRNKPSYDGAVPSGNSVAAFVLLKLGRLTMERRFAHWGQRTLEAFSSQLAQSPTSLSAMLIALELWLGPGQEIVIAGDAEQADTKKMFRLVHNSFLPKAVVLFHASADDGKAIEKIVPFSKEQVAVDDKATAYVCENYVCKRPVNSVSELKSLLSGLAKKHRPDN